MKANLANLLEDFHASILANDVRLALPYIKAGKRLSSDQQLAIYLEGYRLRLAQALQADYPALSGLLGKHAFGQLAADYIEQNPPVDFNLERYGYGFAAFLGGRVDKLARDLATLESAIAEVFMTQESAPLDPALLTGSTPETFGSMRLKLRTALRLLRLDYPVNAWLTANRKGDANIIPEAETQYLLLVRHHHEVKRHELSEAEYHVLVKLGEGRIIGEALEAVAERHPALLPEIAASVQGWFTRWMEQGFF